MRSFGWMCFAGLLSVAACSARGGMGGIGLPDPDAGTTPGDSSTMTGDEGAGPDGPAGPDAPPGLDLTTPPVDGPTPPPDVTPPMDTTPPPPDVVMARCGDGTCNGTENCMSCRDDCGPCAATCGDGTCNEGSETCTTCPSDCGACPPPDVPPTCSGSTCGTCVGSTSCGWCALFGSEGVCVPGNSAGPLGTPCPGTWVAPGRTTSCGTTPPPDGGTTTDPTRPCTGTYSGTARECGWTTVRTLTCTPGRTVTVGCNSTAGMGTLCATPLGTCTGDPLMRVCSGTTPCGYAARLDSANAGVGAVNPSDDTCGTCPVTTVTCPASGQITVLAGNYSNTSAGAGTCSPALR